MAPDAYKNCLTPELAEVRPFLPNYNAKPTKEILEFKENCQPNFHFRNLLYVCPKDLNFSNRTGERARNIAIKVQFMSDTGMRGESSVQSNFGLIEPKRQVGGGGQSRFGKIKPSIS